MLGCEIIEEAQAGNLILWTRARAERTILNHSASLAEFEADIEPSWQDGKIAAATVLTWLGY
jgi:hypothetical protein